RARGRVLHRAQALPERRLLQRHHLSRHGHPDEHVHGDVRPGPPAGLDRALEGDARGREDQDQPAAADLHRGDPAEVRAAGGAVGRCAVSQPAQGGRLQPREEERFLAGAREAARVFMNQSNVHQALLRLVDRLTSLQIPYAIIGALSLNAYGYQRTTVDVDVLLRPEGLASFKKACLGRGYVEKFPGSKGFRDVIDNVKVDVVLTGEYPG